MKSSVFELDVMTLYVNSMFIKFNLRRNDRSKEKAVKKHNWYADGKQQKDGTRKKKFGKQMNGFKKYGNIPTTMEFVPNTRGKH